MSIPTASKTTIKGGAWLLEESQPNTVFTPEKMTEEHRLIYQTSGEFSQEIMKHNDQLETKDWNLTRQLLARAGELGLLGTDVPESYGGLEFDKITSAIIAGRLGPAGSFSTTFGAHTGLAILPILSLIHISEPTRPY